MRDGRSKQYELVGAMRYVADTEPPEDAMAEPTPLHRRCRQWYFDDFKGFMERLSALELKREERRAREKERSADKPGWDGKGACPTCGREAAGADVGEELLDELTGRILAEAAHE